MLIVFLWRAHIQSSVSARQSTGESPAVGVTPDIKTSASIVAAVISSSNNIILAYLILFLLSAHMYTLPKCVTIHTERSQSLNNTFQFNLTRIWI